MIKRGEIQNRNIYYWAKELITALAQVRLKKTG
jgi:hypothetical protein